MPRGHHKMGQVRSGMEWNGMNGFRCNLETWDSVICLHTL